MIFDDRQNYWKGVIKQNYEDKGDFYSLRWEFLLKDNQESIKRDFSVMFQNLKGGNIVSICVADNFIESKEQY